MPRNLVQISHHTEWRCRYFSSLWPKLTAIDGVWPFYQGPIIESRRSDRSPKVLLGPRGRIVHRSIGRIIAHLFHHILAMPSAITLSCNRLVSQGHDEWTQRNNQRDTFATALGHFERTLVECTQSQSRWVFEFVTRTWLGGQQPCDSISRKSYEGHREWGVSCISPYLACCHTSSGYKSLDLSRGMCSVKAKVSNCWRIASKITSSRLSTACLQNSVIRLLRQTGVRIDLHCESDDSASSPLLMEDRQSGVLLAVHLSRDSE